LISGVASVEEGGVGGEEGVEAGGVVGADGVASAMELVLGADLGHHEYNMSTT